MPNIINVKKWGERTYNLRRPWIREPVAEAVILLGEYRIANSNSSEYFNFLYSNEILDFVVCANRE